MARGNVGNRSPRRTGAPRSQPVETFLRSRAGGARLAPGAHLRRERPVHRRVVSRLLRRDRQHGGADLGANCRVRGPRAGARPRLEPGMTLSAPIEGVRLEPRQTFLDGRGAVLHVLRRDTPGFAGFGEIYVSEINPGVMKGWKRHSRVT